MGIRRINAHFARVQQQLTVNGPPLHRPIILSALRIPRISSRACLCFSIYPPPSQPPGKPGPCRGSRPMQAMTFTALPQAGQVSMSMPKTRFKRCAQSLPRI
ncbi:MAG: hypothetical protein ABW080_18900 [Candidatus Thiodiazotropha sp.]